MNYDAWRATNPSDEFLGPEPRVRAREDEPMTTYWAKPIPTRRFDWSAVLSNYDGGDNAGHGGPMGFGATQQEAIDNLLEQIGVEA